LFSIRALVTARNFAGVSRILRWPAPRGEKRIEVGKSVNFDDIVQAAQNLDGIANRTPVMTSRSFNEWTGYEVYFKCEHFQRGGAFKFRGAYHAVSGLDDDDKKRGVIAFSSGNHAQGIALAAKILGIETVIVMPQDTPGVKVEATRGYGAEIVFYDRWKEDREQVAKRWMEQKRMVLIPPFDHPRVIAGAGTAALELLREVPELDGIMTPVGGGGLISGTAIAAHGVNPSIRIVGAEPAKANDAALSLAKGERVTIDSPDTIADGLRTTSLGTLTFPVIQNHVSEIVTVTEEEIIEAMRYIFTRFKWVVEPSGAVTVAALLAGKVPFACGQKIGVIISGGNLDPGLWAKISGKWDI
jgi:threo-3-hydroxy-L-aspartate ammonia-lyase